MADLVEGLKTYGGAQLKGLTRRHAYFLEVPGTASAAALSVASFEAVERMGAPYTVTIQLTHPLELDRADYLGKAATFLIDNADGTEPRKFAGCITRFSKTRQTRDVCRYEIVVEPLVARLRLTRASCIYQHQTAPRIIEAILRRHGLQGHQFAFTLRRKYLQHKFRFQHQISDWTYIRMLMEQEGLYCYFMPGKFGETVVFGDDIDHYIYQPELRVPYRETAGLESGAEAVFDLETHARTVPESFGVADFNPDPAWERPTGEANVARKEKTIYGQSYVYGTHHLDFEGGKWEAQLRHEAEFAQQLVFAGQSNILELRPARILRMDQALPDAPNGQVITEVVHIGAPDAAYRNSFKAIPSDRRFRLPMDEDKWPRIHGTLSARITSPGQYKYACLTLQEHYTVRFDVDFATAAQAIAADYDRQKALLDDTLTELKKAGILVSAPAGMALASGADLQLSAAENLIATSGGNADFSILKRFTVAIGELISVLARKMGIKLFAAKGKVEIEAQSGEMRLLTDKNMTINSASGRVVIEVKDELPFKCGGSHLRISSTGIEDGTRGERTIKSCAFSRQGPSSLAQEINIWKHANFHDANVIRNAFRGEPLANTRVDILCGDGARLKRMTDSAGKTPAHVSD
jgi:Rhs element Vgr protein